MGYRQLHLYRRTLVMHKNSYGKVPVKLVRNRLLHKGEVYETCLENIIAFVRVVGSDQMTDKLFCLGKLKTIYLTSIHVLVWLCINSSVSFRIPPDL